MRKQFRAADFYRVAITHAEVHVQGVYSFECEVDLGTEGMLAYKLVFDSRSIHTNSRPHWCGYVENEAQLKQLVTNINKRLGNCRKPGRRTSNG